MATRMKTGPSKSGSGRTSRRPSITSSTSGLNAPKAEAVLEEEPVQHIEGGVVLTIKILSARNIRGAKGEKVNSFVRVQFADFDYKDSPVFSDSINPQYNFNFEQSFHLDENLVDTFANKKLRITLLESLPKEKTATLGDGSLNLFPHFLKYPPRDPNNPDAPPPAPQLSFKSTVPIAYVNPRLLGKDAEDPARVGPDFEVEVSISKLLIEPEVVEAGTFLTFKVEDALPVPEEWTLKEGTEKDMNSNIFSYNLNFTVPAETTPERLVSIPGGALVVADIALVADPSLSAPQPIMLPKPNTSAQGTTGGVLDEEHSKTPSEAETAAATVSSTAPAPTSAIPPTPADKPDRQPGSEMIKHVAWHTGHVVWIPPEAVVKLREKIMRKEVVEVEFTRDLLPRFSHLTDLNANKYRGRALLDFSCLLFPRVVGLRGRWPLDVFDTPSSPSEANQANVGPKSAIGSSTVMLDAAKKKGKDEVGTNLYKGLGTSLGLEILLEKPLLDKKKLQPITKSVTDFIPRRIIPPHMLYEKRSKKADEEYEQQLQMVVRKLVKEYESLFGSQYDAAGEVDDVQRRKRFFFHLNKSGAYFQFKEQLKGAVVEIVRERFKQKSPFATPTELAHFTSTIYVYLVDQMHVLLNKIFRDKRTLFADPTISKTADFQDLKRFADEAEIDADSERAGWYHRERVARFEDSAQAWFDYGCFCMRNRMEAKGEECFKEILGKNPKHIPSLLAYASYCTTIERYEEARVYYVTAVELQPKYVLAVTLLGLFYDITGEEEESERCLEEAGKLWRESCGTGSPSIFVTAAEFLIHCQAGQIAERALSQELLLTGQTPKPYLLLHRLEVQRRNMQAAEQHLRDALNLQQDDVDVWAALGHLQYIQKHYTDAQDSYETVLSLPNDPTTLPLVYTRLGHIYLLPPQTPQKLRQSRTMYLRACTKSPTSASWLGVSKACIALGEYSQAEDALAEANVLNNRDAEVWAWLGILNAKLEREFEVGQCVGMALRLGIREADVLRTLGKSLLDSKMQLPAAIECLRKCLELEPEDKPTQDAFTHAIGMYPEGH